MNTRQIPPRLSILLVALALSACGSGDPASLIASAKSYLAKNDPTAATLQLKTALKEAPTNAEARLLLAKALLESGDPVGAETEVRRAIEYKYPGDAPFAVLGRALLLQREFPKMIAELSDKSLAEPQDQADLRTSLAFAYTATGKNAEAHAAIDAALGAVPKYPRALVAQAQLAVAENNLPLAFELVDAALTQVPDDPQALMLKADVELAQNHSAQAVKTLERLVELRPDAVSARYVLITMLLRTGQVEIAAAQLDSLKKLAPNDPRTLYSEAMVAYSRGNMQAALAAAQKVLAVAPDHLPSLLLSGLANYQMGTYSAAEEALRAVLARVPNDTGALRTLVATYIRTGRTAAALELLEPALIRTPNDTALLHSAGEVYLASNNPAKAAEMYERATALDKTNVSDRVRLAQVRLASGDTARAFKDLESLADANPTLSAADLALISAHLRRHELEQALAAADALQKKQPTNPLGPNIKGVVYASVRDFKNARASFEQALKLDPKYVAAETNLAQLDFAELNLDGARKRFEKLLAADPRNEQALLSYAGILATAKAPAADVRAAIDKAIAANPASVRPRLYLIAFLTQQRDVKAALVAAQSAEAAFPNNPEVLEILGAAQQSAGESNQALETFSRVAKVLPQNPAPLIRLAGVQVNLKDYDGAIASLQKAIALQPDLTSAWLGLASIYTTTERTDDGLRAARKLQKDLPKRAVGFALEGQMLTSRKKPAEAAVAFREGLAREPIPLLSILAYAALQNAGKPDQAAALAQRWQKEHPKDTQLHTFQGQQGLLAKDYRTAAEHYRAVLEIDPDNVTILNNYAWSLNELGDPKALEYAQRATSLGPYTSTAIDTQGWILVQRGDTKQGIDMLRRAVNLAPQDPDIRLHLAKALLKAGDKAAAKSELETLVAQTDASPVRTEAQQMLKAL